MHILKKCTVYNVLNVAYRKHFR